MVATSRRLTSCRTLEDAVASLLEWAHANRSSSINLPAKPHAIIAINKSRNDTPSDQWSHVTATAKLLRSANAQIAKNKTFMKYAAMWQERSNTSIDDINDLLRFYYSTVNVVRIPLKSRHQLLHEQREVLFEIIHDCCQKTFEQSQRRRMLADVDDFGMYVSLAFDRFAESLDEPFDYMQASLKSQPPPRSMGDHVYGFSKLVHRRSGKPKPHAAQLFDKLTPMIASCLMLEAARKQRLGKVRFCFNSETADCLYRTTQGLV